MKIKCKNCGGTFSDDLEKCPYCSTMNKKGAYKKYRFEFSNMADQMLGLKEETNKSVSKQILTSFLYSLLLIVIVLGLAFVFASLTNVSYTQDVKYDKETKERLIWEDENLEKLEEAYENKDINTISKLEYDNYHVVYNWKHYPWYILNQMHDEIINSDEMNEYDLEKILNVMDELEKGFRYE